MTLSNPGLVEKRRGEIALQAKENGAGVLGVSGDWTLHSKAPGAAGMMSAIDAAESVRSLTFETSDLTMWDSTFVTAVLQVMEKAKVKGIEIDLGGLPSGAQRLVALASAVPERQGARRTTSRDGFLVAVGKGWLDFQKTSLATITFLGEATIALARFSVGRAKFRRVDFMIAIEACGPKALPIVTLISILIGLILAFVGAVQLRQFGAQIFVADLVAIAMAREMAAIMTGIIMAGRTGAAFAAQLGTMQVNEEIDAFRTLGFSPMEFLVLPRMLALIVMMPLLCIYANILGILGGAIVGVGMMGLTATEYYVQTINSVSLFDFAFGVFKGVIFGIVVALAGCLKGIQSGRSASAVGDAATSAVVMSIVLIIVLDGLFAVVTSILGI
ncbi:ABC transporter permease [Meridianimarinicoccus aquatilis]|uniref:ABC transporter permease n=1 Tax=Meridianimarinicoccus aquatilis TaxID=2552766 RepID=A0A4R6B092_9RHOB|nr:ABC transporter permease [Fluviibacterium aquatile]TDL90521.1 ABC transporter permease [Fluviibacterium aquatile]